MGMKFVEEFAKTLLDRAIVDHGAKSLGHLCVVVPTSESGRRLRLALARAAGGAVVPPVIKLKDQFLVDPDDPRLATRTEELIAMREALGGAEGFDFAAQYLDLRRILSEKALSFADVLDYLKRENRSDLFSQQENWSDLFSQWQGLVDVEKKFYASLEKRGKTDRIQLAKTANSSQEEVILPRAALCDIKIADLIKSADSHADFPIVPEATAQSEAEAVAEFFAAVKEDEALPA